MAQYDLLPLPQFDFMFICIYIIESFDFMMSFYWTIP